MFKWVCFTGTMFVHMLAIHLSINCYVIAINTRFKSNPLTLFRTPSKHQFTQYSTHQLTQQSMILIYNVFYLSTTD